jgi:hypothetical protein
VAVSGPDLETLRALAITLITAEDAPVGGLGRLSCRRPRRLS